MVFSIGKFSTNVIEQVWKYTYLALKIPIKNAISQLIELYSFKSGKI